MQTRGAIDEHGDWMAFGNRFVDTLRMLGRRIDHPQDVADRTERVGREWRTVTTRLDEIVAEDGEHEATVEEAARLPTRLADREADIFEDLPFHLEEREESAVSRAVEGGRFCPGGTHDRHSRGEITPRRSTPRSARGSSRPGPRAPEPDGDRSGSPSIRMDDYTYLDREP
ncbi:MAG: hypothetical protein ABEJ44_01375 [Halanaeroarchaeum sp.]